MNRDVSLEPGGLAPWPYDPRQPEAEMLYARYSYGVDFRCRTTLTTCFASDVRFGTDVEEATVGNAATVDRLTSRSVPGTLHTSINVLVAWADRDSATGQDVGIGRADFTMLREGRVVAAGHYTDQLARHDGVLVFSSRVIHFSWQEPRR